ncbi:isoaspartyl peptidase/L-asparaginase family protein [Pontibacter sp. HSC-36F09]|uniref:isoaspartyl peptidase/L-asparaginase family protein n=1 Tax=Pontibacter sp. HSC-36F09 TaxID=2910966 RepID=UPI00209D9A0F|nr:isoaspartyl peptidase/L-asparaginase [Pontibacter sp. HSC-36F09]MCP2045499.1 beta-aspartyl-peptidase (threonine type) [Pontibacter sp. HSC-36F09]
MKKFAIAIHGGAETVKPSELDKEKEEAYREGLADALKEGYNVLEKGGSALDAVEAAVNSMEQNPVFNAARGASLTQRGETEFDAAIMDGNTLRVGAVGGVRYVQHPISLAKVILQKCKHCLLVGTGAEEFALANNLPLKGPEYFVTPEKREAWLDKQQEKAEKKRMPGSMSDTVGAVALDINGNLAAATSTGGLTDQMKGRVGDTPIIGGGTFANNEVCAVSCTGEGEAIMRGVLAHEVYAMMKYAGNSLQSATDKAIELHADKLEGDRGILAMDSTGKAAFGFNTGFMKRGYWAADEEPFVALWESEKLRKPVKLKEMEK